MVGGRGGSAEFSSGKRVSAEALNRATKSLHHRGPDSQGIRLSLPIMLSALVTPG